ncbi:MAG TPA: transglutaminase-like domain-containing protein [Candidatus Acidoferrales bacterium]|nr:transglutaminase-like domain-containing protein [Candidatus Acidoferrales bacterium]
MESFEPFLRSTTVIDWMHPAVLAKSRELSVGAGRTVETARRCFEWVRDNIEHSSDFRRDPVTCAASGALREGTGYCYAKSHLLAALLRASGIPAGFCYQRLSIDDRGAPFSLHGLNAVYLPAFGWYRADPRGNKPGVDAQFCPPVERLAFRTALPEERTFCEILPDPLPCVVDALHAQTTWQAMLAHLPDWDVPSLPLGANP